MRRTDGAARGIALAAMLALAGCTAPGREEARVEAARLRASFERHRAAYVASVEASNRAAAMSLRWLEGPAVFEPRAQAVADAHMEMERWAKAHFGPRVIHEALRFDQYRTAPVKAAQVEMLERLKRQYVEWHDYQRYCQGAAESSMYGTLPGRLAVQLEEFRVRLARRPAAVDEITPLLDVLPR